ncbi:MAG: Wzz/FepE/Etk N-terminal domain-containing protein, partial [Nocardioides sp.]
RLRQPRGAPRAPWAVRALTARPRLSIAVVACGALAGISYHLVVPAPVTVSTSVIVPDGGQDGADDTSRFLPTSLDTLAQMVAGDTVEGAVSAATHTSRDSVSRHLDVSAIPNTRIVNLLYTSTSRSTATAGSLAAAQALLQARADQLRSQQRVEVRGTTNKVDLIGEVVQDYQRGLTVVQAHLLGPVTHNIARQMTIQQIAVSNAWQSVEADRVALLLNAPSNGDLALTPHAMAQPVSWGEPTANGLAGGVLLATGIGLTRPRKRRRVPGSASRPDEVNVKSSGKPNPTRGSMYTNSGEARVARLEPRGLHDPEPVPARAVGQAKSTLRLGSVLLPMRRRWVSSLLTFLAVVLLAGAYSMVHSPTYSSSTTVFLQPLTGNALATASSSNPTALTVAMETEASLASSHQVLDLAAKSLGRTPGPVTAIVPQNTQIVRIRYTGTSPASAEAGATAVANAFLAFRTSQADASIQRQKGNIEKQIRSTRASLKKTLAQISSGVVSPKTTVDVQLLTTRLSGLTDSLATVDALNTNPGSVVKAATRGRPPLLSRPVVELTGGVLLGFVAAFGVALLRERTDDRIHVGRLSSVGGVPVLARISSKDRNLSHFVDGLEPGHPIREAYRRARAGVLAGTSRPAVIAITTFPGAGPVSYTGCNLALALSEAGYRVRIVDASLEDEPRQDFPVGARVGLADHLVSKQLRELKLARWHHVEMLPAGRDLGSVRDLFSSERMSGLLDRLSKVADYLIVLAPQASSSEAAALSGLADATVLVGRDHHTTYTQVRDQVSRYESLDGTVLGLLVLDQRVSTGAAPSAPVVSTADEPT